ncbi:hypothetical protein BOTBODRAFT_338029 [Botryobasidium botryosum FD-172 SS1]|uniref:Uncharacterized protein n=1 Tax=Botryobasidium botryosum (strain FD-172 SS1) TaxID=930990 RepID=A0A067MS15_BOTB1|nr:hypothetical protein BOTBODRAFT_338029 [Botryobasidium botryosum FD-172 SS1]
MEALLPQFKTLFEKYQCSADIPVESHSYQDGLSSRPWGDAQASLDGELDIAQQVLDAATWLVAEIRSRRNQLSPIHRLPNEAISTIFELAKYDAKDPTVHSRALFRLDTQKPVQALLKMSSVSRLWRDIIRGCPTLWATLPPPSAPELLELFLARSKTVPLEIASIIVATKEPLLPSYSALLLPNFGRLRICALKFSQIFQAEDIASFLCSTPAPELEILELYRGEKGMDHRESASKSLQLPHPPFAGCMPRLRHLKLREICVPLNASALCGLVTFYLCYVECREPDSLQQLLHILELSPRLEMLRLHGLKFLTLSPTHQLVDGTIRLPYLQDFSVSVAHDSRINSTSDWILYILSRIEIPATCNLWLYGNIGSGGDLRQFLPQPSHSPSSLPMLVHVNRLKLSLDKNDGNWYKLEGYVFGKLHAAITVIFEGRRGDREVAQRVISTLSDTLPMPSLEIISISSLADMTEPGSVFAFTEFLRSHRTIEGVTLVDSAIQLLELLIITPERNLCPLLTTLRLEGDDRSELRETMLLDVINSRTTHRGDKAFETATHLQRVVYSRHEPLSSSTISALQERVTLEHHSQTV